MLLLYFVTCFSMQIAVHKLEVERHMDKYKEYLPENASDFVKVVRSQWFFLVYVPLFNFLLFLAAGRYILCAILYPY